LPTKFFGTAVGSQQVPKEDSMSEQSNIGVAQDPIQVDPAHYTVEFENEKVRVLRIKYGPREKSKMHGHPASVTIFLTDAEGRFTYPDGKSEDFGVKAGQVMYMDAMVHDPESLSDKPFEVIAVELKG
jgi:quercetin dioxygenase-like cupin family protein